MNQNLIRFRYPELVSGSNTTTGKMLKRVQHDAPLSYISFSEIWNLKSDI